MLIDGNTDGVVMWAVGALFIPSLALALGTWNGTGKAFQIGYMSLWYIGPMQGVRRFDFMGLEPETAVSKGVALIFLIAAASLLLIAFGGRVRQLRA